MRKIVGVCPSTFIPHAIEQFRECPGVRALFFHAGKGAEIHCTTYHHEKKHENIEEHSGEKKTYYMPPQQVVTSFVDNGVKYAIVAVSLSREAEPELLLFVCTRNRHGFLIPKNASVLEQKKAA